jgi:hypothetical protein
MRGQASLSSLPHAAFLQAVQTAEPRPASPIRHIRCPAPSCSAPCRAHPPGLGLGGKSVWWGRVWAGNHEILSRSLLCGLICCRGLCAENQRGPSSRGQDWRDCRGDHPVAACPAFARSRIKFELTHKSFVPAPGDGRVHRRSCRSMAQTQKVGAIPGRPYRVACAPSLDIGTAAQRIQKLTASRRCDKSHVARTSTTCASLRRPLRNR